MTAPRTAHSGTEAIARRRGAFWVFTLVPVACVTLVAGAAMYGWRASIDPQSSGKQLNRQAWEASYTERHRPVPADGPREGYWGSRLGAKVQNSTTGWHEPAISLPGLLEIDARGIQRYSPAASARKRRILIIGGSVASGSYASSITTTYFHVLGTKLEELNVSADLTVAAAGAWKALQELRALRVHGQELRPDLVVFLNGLNDLTNGATSRSLFGEKTQTSGGAPWTPLYHAHDYEQRAGDYLEAMRHAARYASGLGSRTLVVLQPSLAERSRRTPIEETLLQGSLTPHESADALRRGYDRMRSGLREMEKIELIEFLDGSRIFDSEYATTFTDMWHFTDFGHAILGSAIARRVAEILQRDGL